MKYGKVVVVVLFAVLVPSTIGVLGWQYSRSNPIRIDGSFEDWQGVEKTTRARDLGVPENIDIAGYATAEIGINVGESVAATTNGKQLETMAGKNLLGIGENYAVYFYMINWQNMECKLENALQYVNPDNFMLAERVLTAKTPTITLDIASRGTAHDSIHINGDADFASQALSEGGSGDGTENAPYLIEGYDINSAGGSYGIWIENTTVHFAVRNCTIQGATSISTVPFWAAIALNNVQNGKIYIYGSSMYNTIVNNTANTVQQGIALYFSDNNTIVNNSANSNTYGIYLYYPTTTNDVGGNYWYDNSVKEGNYWSNWDGNGWGAANAYPIDGGAGASDWYPMGGPVCEFFQFSVVALLTLCLFGLHIVGRKRRK